ncbi:hypothetical protein L208DRAFT_1257266, partial [Tricholoma matsutake]
VRFINDCKESAINHAEAYQLLIKFHCISGGFVPELQDMAMHKVLKDDVFLHKIQKPCPNNCQLWEDFPIHCDEDAFMSNHHNKTSGAGLTPIPVEQLLDIDMMAQYIMHHGQLGSSNATHGVAMNVALQADHCSIFGYLLGCALGPHTVTTQSDFMQVYGCVVALPGYYCKAIDAWNLSNPNTPFVECSGDSLTIHPYDNELVPNITMDMVTQHLIHHGIPPQWINHAYTFGLHHLNHHSHLQAGPFHELYCNTDHKQLQ